MVADRSFYEAIPGLMDALPPNLQQAVQGFACGCARLARGHGLRLHTHVGESKVQAIAGMRIYGCQSALNSFQGTASKSFQWVSGFSAAGCVA